MANISICSIPDCGKPEKVRGWCNAHYNRWRRHGDPLAGGTPSGEPGRFFRKVVLAYEGDSCFPWPYGKDRKGYGQLWVDGKTHLVSRLVCEETHGAPPTRAHQAAHSCGRGHLGCVTKRHLSWKTPAENQADRLVHGTHSRGELVNGAKLTESQVLEIHAMKGTMLQKEIAANFCISQRTVSDIHQRRRWGWLTEGSGGAKS